MSYALSKEGTIIYVPGGSNDNVRRVLNVDLSGQATDFFDLRKGLNLRDIPQMVNMSVL